MDLAGTDPAKLPPATFTFFRVGMSNDCQPYILRQLRSTVFYRHFNYVTFS
jgi:hypothetical protein